MTFLYYWCYGLRWITFLLPIQYHRLYSLVLSTFAFYTFTVGNIIKCVTIKSYEIGLSKQRERSFLNSFIGDSSVSLIAIILIALNSVTKLQSFRHQICDFSRDIILYDFVRSNICSSFDSKNYSWCHVMIRINTWLSILYLIMGYITFKLYNSSQPCKKVVIELKYIINYLKPLARFIARYIRFCCKAFIRSGREWMLFIIFLRSIFINLHKFSIIFISGFCGCHTLTLIWHSLNYSSVSDMERCLSQIFCQNVDNTNQ